MTILALKGNQDTFKTQTISRLLELMKVKVSGFEVTQDRKRKGSHDFYALAEKKGMKIGLCSYGDTSTLILKYCNALMNAGCSIIIVACHPQGKTKEAVESYISRGYAIEYFDKDPIADKQTIELDAQRLISRINELVSS